MFSELYCKHCTLYLDLCNTRLNACNVIPALKNLCYRNSYILKNKILLFPGKYILTSQPKVRPPLTLNLSKSINISNIISMKKKFKKGKKKV